MLKFGELKEGDLVMAVYDGKELEGEIVDLNTEDKQVCVQTSEDQEFWYEFNHIHPIPLSEAVLFKLGFVKHVQDNGSIKYSKGAFRLLLHAAEDFSNFEMWYREDKRHISEPIFVHNLQNKYLAMTKVHLTIGE